MELRQTQRLTQKLSLTPLMRQSLYILQLPLLELKNYIEKEIEENPVIEKEIHEDTQWEKEFIKEIPSTPEYGTYSLGNEEEELDKKKNYQINLITKPVTLHEILFQQLHMHKLELDQYLIGEFIIHYIDDNGYLTMSVEEISKSLNETDKLKNKITPQQVENILSIIQSMEPIGVGARNLKECLLIQLKAKNKINTLTYKIVENFLAEIARKKTRVIAKKLKVEHSKIKSAVKEISKLEPKPGRIYSSFKEQLLDNGYPDIIVEKSKSGYEIIINHFNLPRFKISSYYKNILKSKSISPPTKKYIQEKIKSALNLKKALSQRSSTLKNVVQHLLRIQKDFFEEGDISLLKPLTLKEIAQLLKRNESTISRVVNSKYIKTNHGIFKLSELFTKSVKVSSQANISREAIKTKIYNIISEEPKKHPITDIKIARILKKENINISRRTIAKYREELKIPPASKRKYSK